MALSPPLVVCKSGRAQRVASTSCSPVLSFLALFLVCSAPRCSHTTPRHLTGVPPTCKEQASINNSAVEPDPATGDLPSSDSDQPTPYAGTQPLLFGVGIVLFTFNPVAITPPLLHMMAVPQHFPRAVGLAAGLSAIIFLVVSGARLGFLDIAVRFAFVQSSLSRHPTERTRGFKGCSYAMCGTQGSWHDWVGGGCP